MRPVIDFESLLLARGAHNSPTKGLCLLEAVAYFAGREHNDHPPCVSPVIGAFGRSWNDSLNDADRQLLKPYIRKMVGTATTPEDEERRAWLATDWLVRTFTPAWLDRAGMNGHATQLRGLPELSSTELANAAMPVIESARSAASAAARDAARAAVWAAAGAAARAAVWAAAGAAAGAAAWATAGAAAGAAMRPTVVELQQSALLLLDRMCEVGRAGEVGA